MGRAEIELVRGRRSKALAVMLALMPTGAMGIHFIYLQHKVVGWIFVALAAVALPLILLWGSGIALFVILWVIAALHGLIVAVTPGREFNAKYNPIQ